MLLVIGWLTADLPDPAFGTNATIAIDPLLPGLAAEVRVRMGSLPIPMGKGLHFHLRMPSRR